MIIPKKARFIGARSSAFAEVGSLTAFQNAKTARLEIEPEGTMVMPSSHVTNRSEGEYKVRQSMLNQPDGNFPAATRFPKMIITKLENAYCLPFGPPVLPELGRIVTEYLIPWSPETLGWFSHLGKEDYEANLAISTDECEYDIDTAFYLVVRSRQKHPMRSGESAHKIKD